MSLQVSKEFPALETIPIVPAKRISLRWAPEYILPYLQLMRLDKVSNSFYYVP